jgi:hypothetical protein
MARSDAEINELISIFQEELNIAESQPMNIVRATGGSVPPTISMIQVILTKEHANFGINLLKWAQGDENNILSLARATIEKIKGA